MIRALATDGEVRAACGDDDLLVWAAQGLRPGARAWALGDAVVAASPSVSRRDRMAVWGGASCAAELVRHALAELGPSYRPFGERELMRRVSARVDGVRPGGQFSWMSLPAAVHEHAGHEDGAGDGSGAGVAWLGAGAGADIAALLAVAAPDSYAIPGAAGVRRWAGLRIRGVLAAVAADAWSAPTVGFLAGVATGAGFRGRGLAERVCRWTSRELMRSHGRAALMVDDDNRAAIGVYERIGYRRVRVMATSATG
ncbi:GNAT family N-acetyltransferase [Nonomuraea purpurea]|uniref:GNAT family N-acetyltransferase n=1 Tax=Nonomuraea purpurea TaxID=1849276 RepID=A0ABV8GEB6_9ACTN